MANNLTIDGLFNRLKKELESEITDKLPMGHPSREKVIQLLPKLGMDNIEKPEFEASVSGAVGIIQNSGNPLEEVEEKKAKADAIEIITRCMVALAKTDELCVPESVEINDKLAALSRELTNIENAKAGHKQWHQFVSMVKGLAEFVGVLLGKEWKFKTEYSGPLKARFWKEAPVVHELLTHPRILTEEPSDKDKETITKMNEILIFPTQDAEEGEITYTVGYCDKMGEYAEVELVDPMLTDYLNTHKGDKFVSKTKHIYQLAELLRPLMKPIEDTPPAAHAL